MSYPAWRYRLKDGEVEAKIFHLEEGERGPQGWKDNPDKLKASKKVNMPEVAEEPEETKTEKEDEA